MAPYHGRPRCAWQNSHHGFRVYTTVLGIHGHPNRTPMLLKSHGALPGCCRLLQCPSYVRNLCSSCVQLDGVFRFLSVL